MDENRNVGAINYGTGSIAGSMVGQQNVYQTEPDALQPRSRADIGVLTVLHQEMRAVVEVLRHGHRYRTHQLYGGAQAHEAELPVIGGVLRVVGLQALERGPHSAIEAYHRLQEHYAPPLVLLVGIAGGIGPGVAIGDVVISNEVIYYDARRESAQGVHRRGKSYPMAPVLLHRLNEFFRDHGGRVRHGTETFQVHLGPVGSGHAVVTDQASEITRWLRQFNEKTLAVETEAGGLAQALYEEVQRGDALRGWLTIRGISDRADAAKGTAYHDLAAGRAALLLAQLLPFLLLTSTDDG